MFKKMFGTTRDEELKFLKRRLILTGLAIVLVLADLFLLKMNFASMVVVIVLLMWGWPIMRALFGVTSVLGMFSLGYHFMFTILILVIYVMLGYLAGLVILPIGLCRFLYLLKQRN